MPYAIEIKLFLAPCPGYLTACGNGPRTEADPHGLSNTDLPRYFVPIGPIMNSILIGI